MKRIDFLVTDVLNQQIEEAMLRLGTDSKAEFFRMLAIQCVSHLNISVTPKVSPQQQTRVQVPANELSKDEKTILRALQTGSQSPDDLCYKTGLSIVTVLSSLPLLLLKGRVKEVGSLYWSLVEMGGVEPPSKE